MKINKKCIRDEMINSYFQAKEKASKKKNGASIYSSIVQIGGDTYEYSHQASGSINSRKRCPSLSACCKESWEYTVKALSVYGGVLGLLQTWINLNLKEVIVYSLVITIATFFVFFSNAYIRFSMRILRKRIKNLIFEIRLDDYIVNLIDLLLEYKDNRNTKLLFALGINETVLKNARKTHNYSNEFVSICQDFMIFMEECLGINIIEKSLESLDKNYQDDSFCVGEKGCVFTVDYKITNPLKEFDYLLDSEFTVVHYVNSTYEEIVDEFTDEHQTIEKVEDGRLSTMHLFDVLSDYIYFKNKMKNPRNEYILMLPAIGAGATGKAPYRTILLEIINTMSIPGYTRPDKVVLSLRNYELFDSEFEASSILNYAKQIFKR